MEVVAGRELCRHVKQKWGVALAAWENAIQLLEEQVRHVPMFVEAAAGRGSSNISEEASAPTKGVLLMNL